MTRTTTAWKDVLWKQMKEDMIKVWTQACLRVSGVNSGGLALAAGQILRASVLAT